MHIKQVNIEGFRSYKDQITTEPFDPRLNAIGSLISFISFKFFLVGANGSGKTNLFHAIRFVVNDVFTPLRQEEREQLLHEGSGSVITTATVEVILDNSDRRFPLDKDEVRLRRSVGLKKDDFFLDKKHITRKEIVDLLETSGISRSNPYYVVQQGKIISMANMRDSERLELLKEIGGAKVYEERRKESIKVITETSTSRIQIEDMIKNIESKLSELDEEREELVRFQRLDKKRRSIEFTLYNSEVHEIDKELQELEVKERGAASKAQGVQTEIESLKSKIKKGQKEYAMLEEMKKQQLQTQKQITDRKNTQIRDHARLELDILELESKSVDNQSTLEKEQEELTEIERKIQEHTTQLNELNDQLQSSSTEEKLTIQRRKDEANCRLQLLLQKQGRDAQFSSAEERDRWILDEIKQLQKSLKENHKVTTKFKQNANQQRKELKKITQEISILEQQELESKQNEGKFEREMNELRKQRDEIQNERRALFKKDADLEEAIKSIKEQHAHWNKQLQKSMPVGLKSALDTIKKLAQELNLEGVYGTVGELINCKEQYFTAVDVAARNHLFSVVVDQSSTAEPLIRHLIQDKLGRVTFIPLDQLPDNDLEHQTENLSDKAFPLVKVLKSDHKFLPVLKHIFGKTALVADLDSAADAAKRGFNCVTLEGDELRKNGAMKGGYYEKSKSKLKAIKETIQSARNLEKKEQERSKISQASDEVGKQITDCVNQIEQLNLDSRTSRTKLNEIRLEIRSCKQQAQAIQEELNQIDRNRESSELIEENLNQQIASLRTEEGTPLNSRLTNSEKTEIKTLQNEIKDLENELELTNHRITKMETQKSILKGSLEENLKLKRDELEATIQDRSRGDSSRYLEEKKEAVLVLNAEIQSAQDEEQRLNLVLEEITKKLRNVNSELDALHELDSESTAKIESEDCSLEKLALEKSRLLQKKEETQKKIRDIGSIPEDALGKYEDHSKRELYSILKNTKKSLSKLTHVNKKAADQYSNFTEQKEEMIVRHSILIKSEDNIKELIRYLDFQKDEAIERTFKQVAKNFKEIFSELVASGTGELIMQKKILDPDEEEEEVDFGSQHSEKGSTLSSVDNYTGVKVKVCFGSGETMSLRQLSGGQKTLVALTLIFAIQQCDPAPFYLFDEIDAALDPSHRTTVAQLLKKQVSDAENPAQFIVTTFNPEIVQQANKIYGVSHHNRISNVNVIDHTQALEFLQNRTLGQTL
eukprot:g2951.t1